MPEPWDIPPWPSRGDDSSDDIFLAVGRALTYWERVEEELANTFAVLVGNRATYPKTEPAIRAYGTIVGNQGRMNMISAAANAYFAEAPDHTLAIEAKEIAKSVKNWAPRRNDVAHGRLGTLQSRLGHFLIPSLYHTKKHPVGEKPAYVYSSEEIKEFDGHFRQLQTRIFTYHRSLARVPKSSFGKRQRQKLHPEGFTSSTSDPNSEPAVLTKRIEQPFA